MRNSELAVAAIHLCSSTVMHVPARLSPESLAALQDLLLVLTCEENVLILEIAILDDQIVNDDAFLWVFLLIFLILLAILLHLPISSNLHHQHQKLLYGFHVQVFIPLDGNSSLLRDHCLWVLDH